MVDENTEAVKLLIQTATQQQQKKSALNNQLKALTARCQSMEKEIVNFEAEGLDLQQKIAEARRVNAGLEESCSSLRANADIELSSKSSLRLTLESLHQKNSQLKKVLDEDVAAHREKVKEAEEFYALSASVFNEMQDKRGLPPNFLHLYSNVNISDPDCIHANIVCFF
jgi:phage-related tail protein